MKAFVSIAVLLLGVSRVQAQDVTTIDIVEFGTYAAELQSAHRDDRGMLNSTSTNYRRVDASANVVARIGTRFGIWYRVNGTPTGAKVDLRKLTIFPSPGLRSPQQAKPMTQSDFALSRVIGEVTYTGWKFDDPWELVPGDWTLQLWYGNRKLAEQVFTIVTQ